MPFKIDSAIMKLDTETGKYDLVGVMISLLCN